MLQLAGLAKQNHAYSRFYEEKELADVPELGVLWYSHLPDISRGKLSGTTIAFTTAFERVVDKEPHRRVRIQYWLRFLEVAVYYFEDVPDFLMNFYLESGEEMRENMLAGVKNNLHNGQYFLEKMWKERMEHYLLELRKAETADDEFANADGNEISDGIASGILNEDAENKIVNANEIIKGSAGENARENTRENSKENTKEDTETRTTWSRFRRCCRCSQDFTTGREGIRRKKIFTGKWRRGFLLPKSAGRFRSRKIRNSAIAGICGDDWVTIRHRTRGDSSSVFAVLKKGAVDRDELIKTSQLM